MSKALVIGGCGYVGSVLVDLLLRESWEVTVIDTFWFGNHLRTQTGLRVIHQDIRLDESLPNEKFDVVFHLANIANDPAALIDSTLSWETNVLAMMKLMEWARDNSVRRFLYASSGSVYGVSEAPRVVETSPLTPISVYNKTKMVAERVALSFDEDVETTIVRPATVCGVSPRMRFDLTVNLFARQAFVDNHLRIDGGSQTRPNIHVRDLARAFVHLSSPSVPPGVYNAGFENLSILEIAEKVAAVSGSPMQASGGTDPRSYRLDSTKLLETGFVPLKGVDDAIEEVLSGLSTGLLEDKPEWHSVAWLTKLVQEGKV